MKNENVSVIVETRVNGETSKIPNNNKQQKKKLNYLLCILDHILYKITNEPIKISNLKYRKLISYT